MLANSFGGGLARNLKVVEMKISHSGFNVMKITVKWMKGGGRRWGFLPFLLVHLLAPSRIPWGTSQADIIQNVISDLTSVH